MLGKQWFPAPAPSLSAAMTIVYQGTQNRPICIWSAMRGSAVPRRTNRFWVQRRHSRVASVQVADPGLGNARLVRAALPVTVMSGSAGRHAALLVLAGGQAPRPVRSAVQPIPGCGNTTTAHFVSDISLTYRDR